MERWAAFSPAVVAVIPVCAASGNGLPALLEELAAHLPEGPALYPEDDLTDQTERAISAEIIRESCINCLREELPYATAVTIERFSETAARRVINATIWVERDSQKAIVIGKHGSMIKRIGQTAREQLIARFGVETQLFLEVRVRPDWTDDPASLRDLGYQS
jgi:GTP-binding protein Era